MLKYLLILLTFTLPFSSAQPPAAHILVAAASDLTEIGKPLGDEFQKETGVQVKFTYGSSGLLAKQIVNGAPYDVFMSANEKFVRDLIINGQVDPQDGSKVFGLGRLAFWSKNKKVRKWEDLAKPDIQHFAIANPDLAPYGKAAVQSMVKTQLWATLQKKVVYAQDVRQALQFAETGNVDVAVVAWTLVQERDGVLQSEWLHLPLRQTAAVMIHRPHPQEAYRFLRFLMSPKGQQILTDHGIMQGH